MIDDIGETSQHAFNDAWWGRFIDTSHKLTKAAIFKNCIDSEKLVSFEAAVLQILRELAKLRTVQYGYRVYVDGRELDSNEMSLLYDTPPDDGEEFEQWAVRVFGDKKFGIILNTGEKFNLGLTRDIAIAMHPLYQQIGYPRDGVNFSIFIGNYDKTPLGIHQDKRGENVMHFHLGPAPKTMFLWEKELYERLQKSDDFSRHNFEQLRASACQYDFERGDIFFMPEGEYHIGKQDGLSIGITVWQYSHTNMAIAKNMHALIFNNINAKDAIVIRGDNNDLDDVSALDEVIRTHQVADELKQLNYGELLRQTYKDWRYRIHSNAGYRSSPFVKDDSPGLTADDEVQIEFPFKILFRRLDSGTKLHVYVRGRKIEFNYFPCIEVMLKKINEGGRGTVAELLALLDKKWDAKLGLYILDELHRWHGLKIVSRSEN